MWNKLRSNYFLAIVLLFQRRGHTTAIAEAVQTTKQAAHSLLQHNNISIIPAITSVRVSQLVWVKLYLLRQLDDVMRKTEYSIVQK